MSVSPTSHDHARVATNRHRESWKAFYNVNGDRAIGELWDGETKIRSFNVKITDGKFKVEVGSSGAKVYFSHH